MRLSPLLAVATIGILISCTPASAARHALLIGCTDYKTQSDLPGSAVDVALLRDQLKTRFQFKDTDITILCDGDDDPTTAEPNFDNISAAFSSISDGEWAEDEAPDVLFVYMSGHGGQKPGGTEKDGFDEFFRPIDETEDILDDQVGRWLEKLSDKNIHVWIVFDSCFSGTMTRGNPSETVRGIRPEPGNAASKTNEHVGWELPNTKKRAGCVAFYACQAFEIAIENSTLDSDPATGKPIPHGLFTYCLLQCLESYTNTDRKITYRDLLRQIIDKYAALGRTCPNPLGEGNMDLEVLGFEAWPEASPLRLVKEGSTVELSGGIFNGITKGSIIAVSSDREGKRVVGYVEVLDVHPKRSKVKSTEFNGKKTVPLEDFPLNSHCTVASKAVGPTDRVELSIDKRSAIPAAYMAAIEKKAEQSDCPFRIVKEMTGNGWSLHATNKKVYLVPNAVVLALPGEGKPKERQLTSSTHVEFMENLKPSVFADRLQLDMQKVLGCVTLERYSSAFGKAELGVKHMIDIRMVKKAGRMADKAIRPGDTVSVSLVNQDSFPCEYVVYWVSPSFSITVEKADTLKPRPPGAVESSHKLWDLEIRDMDGRNSLVVVGFPKEGKVTQPLDGKRLEQYGLGIYSAAKEAKQRGGEQSNPLLDAIRGNAKFRGGDGVTPRMVKETWVVAD